jgi:phospholipid/cholesterol/gamma-HCH transport system substrate-binding protein
MFEIFVGTLVLGLALFFSYYVYRGSHFKETYPLYALFQKIDGLNIGNDVKISGVKVGKVHSYTIDPQTYFAKVKMAIDKNVSVPTDTSADIISESLLGGKYISLNPGLETKKFAPEGVIETTQSSISFEGMVSKYLFGGGGKSEKSES